MSTVPWRALWVETAERLGDANEARWLCQAASGLEGLDWAQGLDSLATARAVARLDEMVARRLAGEPVQYVLGSWSFRTLELLVDRRVLIPRPETELVVEAALDRLVRGPGASAGDSPANRHRQSRPLSARNPSGEETEVRGSGGEAAVAGGEFADNLPAADSVPNRRLTPLLVADLGTGSGAIALSLVAELPLGAVEVWATDRSADALDVARANVAGLGRRGTQVRLAQGDWFDALPHDLQGRLALVVANPPYVGEDDELPAEVSDWEPCDALLAGPDGLDDIRRIVAGAPEWLAPGGWLVLEIGAGQGRAVAALAGDAGLVDVEVRPDLAGRDRILLARRPPEPD